MAPRTGLERATSLLRRRPPRDLDRLLSCRYPRRVAHDNTVRVGSRWVQIPPGPGGRSYVGCRVEVRELLDGRLVVLYQERCLTTLPSPGPAFILRPRAPARPPRSLSASRRSDPDGGRSLPPPRNRPLRHRAAPVGPLPRRRPRIPGAPPFHVAAAPSRRRPGGDDIFTEQLERHFGQRHGRFGLARAESLRKTLVNARERLRMIGNRGPSRAGTPRTPSRSHAPMAQCSSWKWGEAIVRHGRTAEAYMPDFGTSAATATRGSEPVFSSQCVTSVPTGQLSPA